MSTYSRTRTFLPNANPIGGGSGPAISATVLNEYEQAHQDVSDVLDARLPTSGVYALKRAEDPRAYSLTGGADDSTALQACFDAAGVGGAVELPELTINYRSTLTIPSKMELRGTSMQGSVLATDRDIIGLYAVGGEGRALKNFTLSNSSTGTRTTYDIDICNPYKPLIEHVKISLSQDARTKGGIRLYKDAGLDGADRCFMPVLIDVWIANGVLRIADVTDSKIHGGWVWGTYTEAPGAVELSAAANTTFTDLDVVPSVNAGYLISGGTSNLAIIGGMLDGSYDAIHTGWGFKSTDYVRGLVFNGVKFYNMWQGGALLYDVRRATIANCTFTQNNRGEDATYTDINVQSSQAIAVVANNFGAPNSRTTKAKIYTEDSASSDNVLSYNVVEYNAAIVPNGHYYDSGIFSIQPATIVQRNLPDLVWPQSDLLAKTSNYTVLKTDLFAGKRILVTANSPTITLPSAGAVHAGQAIPIVNGGAGTVTVACNGVQTINGSATATLTPGQSITPMSNGSNWFNIAAV